MKKNSFVEGTFIATFAIIIVKVLGVLYVIPCYRRIGEGGGGMLKNTLTEAMNEKLRPVRAERARLEQDPEYIRKVLLTGAEKAREIGIKTLTEVRERMNMVI